MLDLTNKFNTRTNEGLTSCIDSIVPYLNHPKNPMVTIMLNQGSSQHLLLKKALFTVGYSVAILKVPSDMRKYFSIYTISLCDVFDKGEVKRCTNCGEYSVINSLITNKHYCASCGESYHDTYF